MFGCENDEQKAETFLCCSDNPFSSTNINTLGNVDYRIPDVFTPNEDGNNDEFIIAGLDTSYDYSIVIYDLNDVIVFTFKKGDNNTINWFDGKNQKTGENLAFGTYKYKIVIKDEQSFLQQGYVCIVRNKSEVNGYDFSNCKLPQNNFDDVLQK